jgi:metallophosphoesterase (TIGR00282 family)
MIDQPTSLSSADPTNSLSQPALAPKPPAKPAPAANAAAEPVSLRVLAVGDIIGSPGRRTLTRLLPGLRAELKVDLVIANGENSAGGKGVSARTARELRDAGVDVITTGNHVWAQADIDQALADDDLRILRPLNFPSELPGRGVLTIEAKGRKVTVVSLLGRVFMNAVDDPFKAIDTVLLTQGTDVGEPVSRECVNGLGSRPLTIVDFHAEATSEKVAMGWHLAGRVAAMVGTHTHVPTADARVLPGETGYVTDLGMVGPRDSVIGAAIEPTLRRFITQRSARAIVPDGPVIFNAVLVELDADRGTCRTICRVDRLDATADPNRGARA